MRTVRLPFLFSGLAFVLLAASDPASSQEIIPAARRIDWSYAGIPGGIPTRTTICKTIDSATYGNGSTDATSAIQNAITNCPNDQIVYVPAGTYLINGTISLKSNCTLRGAGQGLTILKAGGGSRNQLISILDSYIWNELNGSPLTHNITSATKDSQMVTLDSVSGISVGDVLLLNQLNDETEVTEHGIAAGTPTDCTFCGLANGTRSLGQLVGVTGINGNQVSINVPLHWTYNTNLIPWAYLITGAHIVRYAGLEDLTLTQDSAIVDYAIFVDGAQYSWIKGVEISNVASDGIFIYYMLQSELRENYLHGAIGGYGNSAAYGIMMTMYSSNNRVEDNIIDTLSNGGIENHGGASGNVMSYNYFHNIIYVQTNWLIASPALNHGAYSKMNLWEGNIGYKAQGDDVWGSSGYLTIFRSRSFGYESDTITATNAAIQFSPLNHYMNVVGSVLGTSGKSTSYQAVAGDQYSTSTKYIWVLGISNQGGSPDSEVPNTILRHGNFDYVTNSTVWDPNISNHTLPSSLYLSQKPSWWCQETPWPPIGPDVTRMVNAIPAERRFEALPCTPTTLPAPQNLRIFGK